MTEMEYVCLQHLQLPFKNVLCVNLCVCVCARTHTYVYMTKIWFYGILYLCVKVLDIRDRAHFFVLLIVIIGLK